MGEAIKPLRALRERRNLPTVPLRERLLGSIGREGPMPFEAFMDCVLYDPEEGYFAAGPLRSTQEGDFLTSPEVSPLFGATLHARSK